MCIFTGLFLLTITKIPLWANLFVTQICTHRKISLYLFMCTYNILCVKYSILSRALFYICLLVQLHRKKNQIEHVLDANRARLLHPIL